MAIFTTYPGPIVRGWRLEIHERNHDMSAANGQIIEKQPVQRPRVPLLAADTVVYGLLAALVWGAWRLSQLDLFTAGDAVGYWLGVAGGVMMLVLLLYSLRKRFRFARSWGNIRGWFVLHMLLGVFGPLLILVHSTFRVGSLNAGVALYSMVTVALSGVVGRFLFQRVNRGLDGAKTDLQTLTQKAGLDRADVRSRLAFAPRVEAQLKAFEQTEMGRPVQGVNLLRTVFWLPLAQYRVHRQCAAELDALLPRMAQAQHWSAADLDRRRRHSKKLVRRYLLSVVRVTQYSAYASLFSLWHVAHIPFVYLLIATALVHVYAVHAY